MAPAIPRAVAILDILAENGAAPYTLSEIARRLAIPKSSVANLCKAMVESGLLVRKDGGFSLGRKLAELGGAYLASADHVREFHDACRSLATAAEETIQLAVLDKMEVIYLSRHDGRQFIRLASEIGRRLPATCTAAGKVALAALSPADLADRLLGLGTLPVLTEHSIRTSAELLADLEATRLRGYAIDDEETADGVVCFAVTVPGRHSDFGPPAGPWAVSVALLKARATDDRRGQLLLDLRELSRRLAPLGREMFGSASYGQ
jgi:IclR family transcriptional regulator, blcABC operon repressor